MQIILVQSFVSTCYSNFCPQAIVIPLQNVLKLQSLKLPWQLLNLQLLFLLTTKNVYTVKKYDKKNSTKENYHKLYLIS